MKIDIHNYETYMMDYLDGNLEVDLIEEMEAFLLMHPDIAEDIEDVAEIQLSNIGSNSLDHDFILELKKKEIIAHDPIHEKNYQDFFIGHWEGDLNQKEALSLQHFLASNSFLVAEYEKFKNIKLKPSLGLLYSDKTALKRKNNKLIALWSVASSVAALLLLAFWLFSPSSQREIQLYEPISSRYLSAITLEETTHALEVIPLNLEAKLIYIEEEVLFASRLESPDRLTPRQNPISLTDLQWQNELAMIQSMAFDRNLMQSQIDWASLPGDKNRGTIKLISSLLWNTTKGQVKNMGTDFIQEEAKLFGSENLGELTGGFISIKKPVKEVE